MAASLLAGCAASPSRVDPFEPMNRALFEIHTAVDEAVMRPAIQMYIDVVPEPVRQAVSNFFNNIDDMISVVNDVLQGKFDKIGNDMGRVMLNTGFGLGGLFDLASMVGIERGNEDFGQTFGVWGFDQGPYLFVPLLRPDDGPRRRGLDRARRSRGRSATFPTCRCATSSTAWAPSTSARSRWRRRKLVDTAALDRYLFIRNAYLQRRRYLVYDGKPPPEPEEE